ncbi:MAG TPA: Ig-like domain-containing protein [Candidatus Limnocylindrales bacterium]|nr:Ig-like domain-containing protein [Candidatus Limnocylindrales bacterium]
MRTRPVTPSPTRLAGYRRIERRRGLPVVIKAFLAVAVITLGGAILWVSSGAVGPFVSSAVAGFGGLVSKVGVVAGSPAVTAAPEIPDAPSIDAPPETFTNRDTVNVTVNVPTSVTGIEGYTVRLYVTLKDADPVILVESPVGETAVQVMTGVTLSAGRNDIQAAVFGPGGESERSEVAAWILDTSKPKVSVISPKNNAQVQKTTIKVRGKSQAGAEIRLQNANNGAIATTRAGADGLWAATIEVGIGGNAITVTATDPAGNQNTTSFSVRKGSGKLTAVLTASSYRFRASRLPRSIILRVVVTDPEGRRLSGATALFTVSVPGIEAIVSSEITTNGDGVATFQTNIPSGATKGSGLATVLVTSDGDGNVTDRQVLTIVE